MKQISIIVAIAEDLGIGRDNQLLCHVPGDLQRFRKITTGHTVIMGKNTFLSLPGGPLKNRRNIVITDNRSDRFDGCKMVFSMEEALSQCMDNEESFVIGGASIYRQFLPLASKLYLTFIHKRFDADTFFPDINYNEWMEISKEIPENQDQHDFSFEFRVLQRKN